MSSGVEGTTHIVGIFGDPVDHSLSPRMHNAAYRALGIDFVYVPLSPRPTRLGAAVEAIRVLGLAGVNVTVPFKERVTRYLDAMSTTALAVGAVNTIVCKNARLFGDNTDVPGFAAALAVAGFRIRGKRALVIGAGGGARGVIHALLERGAADIVVANRTAARGRELARKFSGNAARIRAAGLEVLGRSDLLATRQVVVNCTTVGLDGGDFLPYDVGATPGDCTHFDLAYREGETPFLSLARKARRPAIDGRHMLLHQGALAFKLFTGKRAPLDVMARAIGIRAARTSAPRWRGR